MGYQVFVPPSSGGGVDSRPPASSYDLGAKIRAAVAVGCFVAVGLTVLMWGALALIRGLGGRPPWQAWLATLGLALFIGLGVTCWFGYEWVVKVAVRAWVVDDDERAYQRKQIEDARKAQEQAAAIAKENIKTGPMDHDHDAATFTLEQDLNLVAWEMLARACLGRGKPTREAMEADGCCTQQQWNVVNEAMQKIGLRKGYTWQTVTFEEAWDCWRANFRVQVDGDGEIYAWAMKLGGNWKVVERVT